MLVVLGILGIVLGIGFLNGGLIARRQERTSFVTSVKQLFWRGATLAASRGGTYKLEYDGQKLEIIPASGGSPQYSIKVPAGVSLSLQTGEIVDFTAPGRVVFVNLPNDCAGTGSFTLSADGKTYCYRLSLIGEVEVTSQ